MTPWHDMTSWNSPWLVFEEEKPWLVVGDMYFFMVWPISSMIFRAFPASTLLKLCIDWSGKSSPQEAVLVHLHSQMSCCHCLGVSACFFWAGPQSQWSYAKSFVWWVWTFKLAKMQISWTPKQHWTQFSVRLLATQSVSKFSCQVLIPNKLYIACIYIHNHIYTILHTHRACYVSSQVAKNPSAWWVICGVLQAQDAMFSTEDSRAAADVTTWARPKPGRGDVYFLPEVCFFSRWIYWDEPNKRIWVCYFCWDLCGEVWWNATDYLGPKRFGNRSNFVPTILGSSRSFLCEQQRERNIFRKRSSTAMCKPIMESSWTFIPFAQSNNPTTESP